MPAASILPVVSSANVTLASPVTVLSAKMLMSAISVSTTVINSLNARTNTVPSHADVVHDSLVSPTSMAVDKNVLTSMSVLLVLTTVTPTPAAPTQLVASTAHVTLVMKVMVLSALTLMSALLELTTAVPTQFVLTLTVDSLAPVPLVSSRRTETVSISMSASPTKTTVATMLHAPTHRVVSSALAMTDSPEMVLPAMMLTSALTTPVVIMLLVITPTVVSNVSVTPVLSRRTERALMSTSAPTTRRTTATVMPSAPIFLVASHVPASPTSRVMV